MSVRIALIDEIERVSRVRQILCDLKTMPGVNVVPAVAMMTQSIDRAKRAAIDADPAEAIRCLEDLRGYTA